MDNAAPNASVQVDVATGLAAEPVPAPAAVAGAASSTAAPAQVAPAPAAAGAANEAPIVPRHTARAGADRAKQFMPFATLRGYYDAVKAQDRIPAPRRELQEEDIERISATLSHIGRGDVVRITYYDADAYVTTQGAVSEIVPVYRWLVVVKTRINFEDIASIEML